MELNANCCSPRTDGLMEIISMSPTSETGDNKCMVKFFGIVLEQDIFNFVVTASGIPRHLPVLELTRPNTA